MVSNSNGGYGNNKTISDHIWDTFAQVDTGDGLGQVNMEQESIPHLHTYWLTSKKTDYRQE